MLFIQSFETKENKDCTIAQGFRFFQLLRRYKSLQTNYHPPCVCRTQRGEEKEEWVLLSCSDLRELKHLESSPVYEPRLRVCRAAAWRDGEDWIIIYNIDSLIEKDGTYSYSWNPWRKRRSEAMFTSLILYIVSRVCMRVSAACKGGRGSVIISYYLGAASEWYCWSSTSAKAKASAISLNRISHCGASMYNMVLERHGAFNYSTWDTVECWTGPGPLGPPRSLFVLHVMQPMPKIRATLWAIDYICIIFRHLRLIGFLHKHGRISNGALERPLSTNIRKTNQYVSTQYWVPIMACLPTNFRNPFSLRDDAVKMTMSSSPLIQISPLRRNNNVFA